MKFIPILGIVFLLLLSSLACSLTGIQKLASSDVLFSDDFSNTDKKWDQVDETSRSTSYYNGGYRILINETNSDAWANPGNGSFTDVSIEVDATKNGGTDDNDFGLICRYGDIDKFYYAVMSSDGYYGILKMTTNGGTILGAENLLESNDIKMGDATNHVRFDCVGPTLTLYINGNKVAEQSDSDYSTGNVGMIAGSFDTPGVDIFFDDFIVRKP